ncbi:MAG: dTDP-4-dehydrorhamnose 3,5-epimerase [Deltaproteobacteria bacterium]|nr:dTDP-4-dehydrorhamnose 3,5-epimerase [Deltaproteobacteria bacterium]
MTKASRFDCTLTRLQGLVVVQRKPIRDVRGFFARFYCADEYKKFGMQKPIAQINHTLTTKKGVVRGLHFQYPPHSETKVVSCIRGEAYDVAVDIRKNSPTFLKWHAEILSAENRKSLLIPEGFAHGFQTMTDDCELLYLHTERYVPSAEGALNVQDPRVGIAWPLPITELSDRDRAHPFIDMQFNGVTV